MNGDGDFSAQEIYFAFGAMDTNKNGKVSKSELVAWINKNYRKIIAEYRARIQIGLNNLDKRTAVGKAAMINKTSYLFSNSDWKLTFD